MSGSRVLGLAASCVVLAFGCSDDKQSGPGTTPPQDTGVDTGGTISATSFKPSGCAFTVGQLEEFPGFEANVDVLGTNQNDGKNDYGPKPKFVRVGLGGGVQAGKPDYADPSTSFAVLWQTDPETKATKLRFAQDAATVATAAPTTGLSYVIEQEATGGPADGVRFHEAFACGLQAGRTYYYQVGGGPAGAEVWSAVHSYTTAPARTDPVMIGFAGDTRDDTGRSDLPVLTALGGRMKTAGVHAMTFSGDYVYAGVNQDMWELWGKATDAFGGELFMAMSPGNHDNEQMRYFANALMPGAIGKNFERYASFDYGAVHLVMIDDYDGIVAESIDSTGYKPEVLAWLDADLAAANANRANVPFIMTFHHYPLYSSTTQTERAAERTRVRTAVQAMFDKHHVDLDVTGHDHFYERFKPIAADAESPTGTNYVICAAGGAPAYGTKATPLSAKIEAYDPAKREGIYGIVTADPKKMAVRVYKMNGATGTSPADDTIVDELTLTR